LFLVAGLENLQFFVDALEFDLDFRTSRGLLFDAFLDFGYGLIEGFKLQS
jgi:hypothetical protein